MKIPKSPGPSANHQARIFSLGQTPTRYDELPRHEQDPENMNETSNRMGRVLAIGTRVENVHQCTKSNLHSMSKSKIRNLQRANKSAAQTSVWPVFLGEQTRGFSAFSVLSKMQSHKSRSVQLTISRCYLSFAVVI